MGRITQVGDSVAYYLIDVPVHTVKSVFAGTERRARLDARRREKNLEKANKALEKAKTDARTAAAVADAWKTKIAEREAKAEEASHATADGRS